MPSYAEQIAASRDRITSMLEKSSRPTFAENVMAGLSGAFGTGKAAEDLNARTGTEGQIGTQKSIYDLLRQGQSDDLSERKMAVDEGTLGVQQDNAVLKAIELKAQQGDKDASAVNSALTNLVKEPSDRAKVALALHQMPEKITAANAGEMVAKAAQDLKIGAPSGGYEGTGFDAQNANIIRDYNDKKHNQEPTTPSEDRAYALAVQAWETPYLDPLTGDRKVRSLPEIFVRVGGSPQAAAAAGGAAPGAAPVQPAPEVQGPPQPTPVGGGPNIYEAAREGTGFWSGIKALLNEGAGMYGGQAFPATQEARNTLRVVSQFARPIIANGVGRISNQQMTWANDLLASPDNVFANPATAEQNMRQLYEVLKTLKGTYDAEAQNGALPVKQRQEAIASASELDRVLGMMGPPPTASQRPGQAPAVTQVPTFGAR